jgi:hypothetical protein
MKKQLQKQPAAADLASMQFLFGPLPVLSTEDRKAAEEVLCRFLECFRPQDFMEQSRINDLTNETWEMRRLKRHMILAIERKVREFRKFEAERFKQEALNKAKLAEKFGGPPVDPDEVLQSVIKDVEAILNRPIDELEHARALETSREYYEWLNKRYMEAMAMRNETLAQFERYREGLGHLLRSVSDEIVNADFSDADPQPKQIAAE